MDLSRQHATTSQQNISVSNTITAPASLSRHNSMWSPWYPGVKSVSFMAATKPHIPIWAPLICGWSPLSNSISKNFNASHSVEIHQQKPPSKWFQKIIKQKKSTPPPPRFFQHQECWCSFWPDTLDTNASHDFQRSQSDPKPWPQIARRLVWSKGCTNLGWCNTNLPSRLELSR